ncbi:MAG: hypothetical protein RDU14_01920 [Melioribacteraceae bacterium]|nr:hypothetical protein [Melioribacteraceae bacterium]
MIGKEKIRNLLFILLGVLVLVLKHNYNGPYTEMVKSYSGNISVSFAVYFLICINADNWKKNRLITAVIALLIVEIFEITNGFGIMKNVFDAIDLLANLIGVSLALVLDQLLNRNTSGNTEVKNRESQTYTGMNKNQREKKCIK